MVCMPVNLVLCNIHLTPPAEICLEEGAVCVAPKIVLISRSLHVTPFLATAAAMAHTAYAITSSKHSPCFSARTASPQLTPSQ
jgi:hypothetical protein